MALPRALPIALTWLCLFRAVWPLNFLFFLIGTNQFERHTFEFLAQELARRGHKVVTVKPILIPEEPKLVKQLLHMVHEKVLKDVLPEAVYAPLERVGRDVPWRNSYEMEAFEEPYWAAHRAACQKMLDSNLMEVLAREQMELAILYTGNPCQLGFVHALGIPFVLVDLEGITDETLIASGSAWDLPSVFVDEDRSRQQRAVSSSLAFQPMANLFWARSVRAISLAREALAQSGVPALCSAVSHRCRLMDDPIWAQFQSDYELNRKFRGRFPNLNLLKSRAELYLVNSDPLLESPARAFHSRLLPIGGVHIDAIRPLFAPWNQSIASAERGVILVSLGTQANTDAMPEQLVRSLLHAFGHLTGYRIFWRLSPGLALPGLTASEREQLLNGDAMAHLNITAYFSQNELLAHPRTRLLVTNGGAHSLMEALHWGVPVLGIPLYGQNLANLEKVRRRGLGLWLDKNEARHGSRLLVAIRQLLNDPRFSRTAKDIGREVRSRPASAFERTLHALESAARRRCPGGCREEHPLALLTWALRLRLDLLLGMAILLALLAWITRAWLKLARNCCLRIATTLAIFGGGAHADKKRRLKAD